jgi:hypothetical protein
MSDPIQNPFGVNVSSGLLQSTGLTINSVTTGLVGTSTGVTNYTPGSIVSNTCLNQLTSAIQAGYNTLGFFLNTTTYENLISIGAGSIPALGNSMPPTYTWIGPANSGDPTSLAAQAIAWYPYTATATTNYYPSNNPTPLQWSSITQTTYNPNITQWGWIRLFALQAWNEFNWNNSPSNTSIVYRDFLSSFQTCSGFLGSMNPSVTAVSNSSTFLMNTYSNNDDLMTSDITGVNLATNVFGQDLIALGKALDLANIDKFGLPSVLLLTLQKYNAMTGSLSYALLSSGLSTSDINGILNGTITPTASQEQQIYSAFSIMTGVDLANSLIPLNCSTPGLTSLVDLLNPQMLFPNSYSSLTVPVYNAAPGPTNAKTYYTIYSGTGVNSQLSLPSVITSIGASGIAPSSTAAGTFQIIPVGFGAYSRNILPEDISIASGAFSFSMQQITNIMNVPIEKFAQVVASLETSIDLPLTAGTNVPVNSTSASTGLNQIAYGSGPNGSYTMSDFFGCMSGLPYQWTDIQNLILQLQSSTLATLYQEIYTTISTATEDVSSIVQGYINSANTEIQNIMNNNPGAAALLNRSWDVTGTQLTNEQRARNIALAPVDTPRSNTVSTYPGTILSYVNQIQTYSTETDPNMHSQTITAISDLTGVTGQSQVALLRSIRNQARLQQIGVPVPSAIPNGQTPLTSSILSNNGTVSTAQPGQGIPAGSATFTVPADSNVLPNVSPSTYFDNVNNVVVAPTAMTPAPVLGSIPVNATVGQDLAGPNIMQVSNPITPIAGGFLPQGPGIPINTGASLVPGSLAGSPYQNLLPTQLTQQGATYSVPEAIDKVVECNCDCWLQ